MTEAYVCNRCDTVMRRRPDNIVSVRENSATEPQKYHVCDACKPEVMVFIAGNDDHD